jgi:hypothetical protein
MRLLHSVRALKDDVDILRKCPWGEMTLVRINSKDCLLLARETCNP